MRSIKFILLTPVALLIFPFSTACNEASRNFVWPWNEIISIYQSPKIESYKIRSVSLLPMVPDDTTDNGTFYSTNHFINLLEKEHPAIKFVVSDIDTAISNDSSAISKVIYSIEKKRRLDLKRFSNSELGYDVLSDSTDAMLIGIIDSCKKKNGNIITGYQFGKRRIISCNFAYYLISLKDGRVLWKAEVVGEEGYMYSSAAELFPPLDNAISNGMDLIVKKIPLY
ncbi:hypothetical protein C0389_00460 [bacterium]|nr:hypothetical protein [bacterium]